VPAAPPAVPLPLTENRSFRSRTAASEKLVASPEAESLLIEQHRRLGAALHDLQGQHGLKILMVSSAVQQEGKTLTISNLALTLSESFRRRVLLIDADLRRPAVHEVFGIPNDVGLTDMVRKGGASVPLIEVSPGLSILTAGRPEANPLSPLMSDRLGEVVSQAAARFDWVLLDTPPIGMLPDAQLVARVSEGILFVIAAGTTDHALVQRCINELGPERIVGTVLNRVEPHRLAGRHGYGGYYQRPTAAAVNR
jgi:capsular exopolysaccharide synthesis family protein